MDWIGSKIHFLLFVKIYVPKIVWDDETLY